MSLTNKNRLINKKINEVKEVIQNRPNNEIRKLLEYYDFDVGKTIEAFVSSNTNDIKKILSINSNNTSGTMSPKQQQQQQQQIKSSSSSSSIINNNDLNNKLNKLNNNKFKFNLNDLVDSVISKHITTKTTSSTELLSTTISSSSSNNNNNNNKNNNTINNDTRPNTLNISPSPSSIITTNINNSDNYNININNNSNNSNNSSNIGSNKVLEKSQKDLQRQIITLNKLKTNFDEEIENSLKLNDDVFNNLRLLLELRQINLKNKLDNIKLNGRKLKNKTKIYFLFFLFIHLF
jgi:hypothetical protein